MWRAIGSRRRMSCGCLRPLRKIHPRANWAGTCSTGERLVPSMHIKPASPTLLTRLRRFLRLARWNPRRLSVTECRRNAVVSRCRGSSGFALTPGICSRTFMRHENRVPKSGFWAMGRVAYALQLVESLPSVALRPRVAACSPMSGVSWWATKTEGCGGEKLIQVSRAVRLRRSRTPRLWPSG